MKVAITAQDNTLESTMDERFGRAKYLVIYDTERDDYQIIENTQNYQAIQGAGIQTATTVVNEGVQYVVTRHCGPKAFQVLKQSGVKVLITEPLPIKEIIEKFKKGELKELHNADVQGHWM